MGTKLYKNWWFLLLKGVMAISLGLMLVLIPGFVVKYFNMLFGILIGLGGIFIIIGAISHRQLNYEWTWWLLEGIIDLIISVIIILNPVEFASVVVILIGVWIVLMGAIQIITSINIQYYLHNSLIFGLSGGVAVVLGILLMLNTEAGIKSITMILGIISIFYGLSQAYISFHLKRIVIEEIGEVEDIFL